MLFLNHSKSFLYADLPFPEKKCRGYAVKTQLVVSTRGDELRREFKMYANLKICPKSGDAVSVGQDFAANITHWSNICYK